jgi:hypothetical protein
MNRLLAIICALLFAALSVSSACLAAQSNWIRFTLEPQRGNSNQIRADFRHEDENGSRDNHWSADFAPSELTGLDVPGFRGAGAHPLRFALIREAGRLDCSGTGGDSYAHGNCSFTEDPGFMQLLASRGIARPDREQAFGMMAVGVRRELIEAISAAQYPTPTIDNLIAMTAVGVDGRYISELARAGYRPRSVDTLIQFRAMGITPEWVGGFARIGYAGLPADELVQLKALNITPEFIAGFDRAGYRHLAVDTLVQLKALDITPEFARWAAGQRSSMPSVDELVQMKIFGQRR